MWWGNEDGDKSYEELVAEQRAASREAIDTGSGVQDFFTSVGAGVLNLPSTIAGLADIPLNLLGGNNYVQRATDTIGEATGFSPDDWAADLKRNYLSAEAQQKNAEFRDTEGFMPSLGYLLDNPSVALNQVGESLPSMFAGGALGKAAKMAGLAKTYPGAAAMGEGAIMAGEQSKGFYNLNTDTDPNNDVNTFLGAIGSVATGVVGAGVGYAGGKLAQKLGLDDIDVVMAGGGVNASSKSLRDMPLAARMGYRAGVGGALEAGEEFAQTGAETILSNAVQGNELTEGLGNALAAGLVSGGIMGGVANAATTPLSPIDAPKVDPVADRAMKANNMQELSEILKGMEPAKAEPIFNAWVAQNSDEVLREGIAGNQEVAAGLRADEARKAFAAGVDELVANTKGLGTKRAKLLKNLAMNTATVTTEDLDLAVEGWPTTAKEAIKQSEWYQTLAKNEADAADTAARVNAARQAQQQQAATDEAVTTEEDAIADEVIARQRYENAKQPKVTISEEGTTITGDQTQIDKDAIPSADAVLAEVETLFPEEPPQGPLNISVQEGAADRTAERLGEAELTPDNRVLADLLNDFTDETDGKARRDKPLKQRIAAVYKALGGGPKARATMQLFGAVHRLSKQFEDIGSLLASETNLKVQEDADGNVIGVTRVRGSSDHNKQPTPNPDFRAKDRTTERGGQTVDAAADAQIAEAVTEDDVPGPVAALSARYLELGERLDHAFKLLDRVAGENNIAKALGVSKEAAAKGGRPIPNAVPGAETKAAIRFSQLNRMYNQGDLPTVLRTDATGAIRYAKEIEKKFAEARTKSKQVADFYIDESGNPVEMVDGADTSLDSRPRYRLEEIISDGLNGRKHWDKPLKNKADRLSSRQKGKVQSPIESLLEYASKTPLSGASKLVAKHLLKIMQQTDSNGRTLGSSIRVRVLATEANPSYDPVTNTITFGSNRDTHTVQAILHEAIHAATANLLSRSEADLSSQQVAARDDLVKVWQQVKDHLLKTNPDLKPFKSIIDAGLKSRSKVKGKPAKDKRQALVELQEFMSYALTDYDLQLAMKDIKPAKLADPTGRYKNLWKVFAYKLKRFLGLNTESNTAFAQFIDVSSVFMGYGYAAATRGNNTTLGRSFNDADLAQSPLEMQVEPGSSDAFNEAEARAATDRAKQNTKQRIQTAFEKRAPGTEGANEAISQAEARQEQDRQADADRQTAENTGTSVAKKADLRPNATVLDALERAIFDAFTNLITLGKYKSYSDMAEAGINWVSVAGNRWVHDGVEKGNRLQLAVGKILSKVVDQYGMRQSMKGLLHAMESSDRELFDFNMNSYLALKSLDVDMQQAIVDYLQTRDEIALNSKLNDEAKVATVTKIIERIDGLVQTAKYRNLIPQDAQVEDLFDFTKGGEFALISRASYQTMKAHGTNFDKNTVFLNANVEPTKQAQEGAEAYYPLYDKNGHAITGDISNTYDGDPTKGGRRKRFIVAVSKDGNDFRAYEYGVDSAVMQRDGYVPNLDEPYLYYAESSNAGGLDFRLARRRTLEEIAKLHEEEHLYKPDQQGVVPSQLAIVLQELGRKVDGSTVISQAISDNYLRNDQGELVDLEGNLVDAKNAVFDPNGYIYSSPDGLPPPSATPQKNLYDMSSASLKGPGSGARYKAALAALRVPGTWAKVENDPTVWGDLAGKYVEGPVYMALFDHANPEPFIQWMPWRKAMQAWKNAKTTLSPVAHVNNVIGNFVLSYYHDIPMGNIAEGVRVLLNAMADGRGVDPGTDSKALRATLNRMGFKGLEHKDNRKYKELYEEMVKQGITLGQIRVDDFDNESINDWFKEDSWVNKAQGALPDQMKNFVSLQKLLANSAAIYSNQDNIFRLAKYMTEIQRMQNLGLPMTPENKQKAAMAATEAFVDYRIHAPWVRGARETVMPFVAWPYRMVPLMARTMVMKPWKALNTMAAVQAVNMIAYALLGADEDDEEYERRILPEWQRHDISWLPGVPTMIRLPFGEKGEEAYWYDASRSIPLADVLQTNEAGIPGPLQFGGPAIIGLNALMNYDPFTGREIAEEGSTPAQRLQAKADYLKRALLPGAYLGAERVYDRQIGNRDLSPLGNAYDPWVDVFKMLGGSAAHTNMADAQLSRSKESQYDQMKAKMAFNKYKRKLMRKDEVDYQAVVDAQVEFFETLAGIKAEQYGVE